MSKPTAAPGTGVGAMTITQAAAHLGIATDTLYRYAATGVVPAFKLGNRWRFRQALLDEYMDRKSMENLR